MRIYITAPNGKKSLMIPLPTRILALNPTWRKARAGTDDIEKLRLVRKASASFAGTLQRYARKNGHFDFITIQLSNGPALRIRI